MGGGNERKQLHLDLDTECRVSALFPAISKHINRCQFTLHCKRAMCVFTVTRAGVCVFS